MVASSSNRSRNSPTVILFSGWKVISIEGIQKQAAYVVLVRINQRILHDFVERQIRKLAFRRNPLTFRARGKSGQLIAGLHLVRLGKKLTKIRKYKSFGHKVAPKHPPANFT